MSMLSAQADELRMLAGGLRKLYENGANLTRAQVAGLTTAVEAMREAADTIESMRDRLQESYKQYPEQVKRENDGERESYSHYEATFGTPERAAWTLSRFCADCSCGDCATCGVPEWADYTHDYDALLEWLRGDA